MQIHTTLKEIYNGATRIDDFLLAANLMDKHLGDRKCIAHYRRVNVAAPGTPLSEVKTGWVLNGITVTE